MGRVVLEGSGGSKKVMGPAVEKLKDAKEWDWDMVAWIKAGIRVQILDTKTMCICLNFPIVFIVFIFYFQLILD